LANVAEATGLNIIMGTAYYVESSFLPELNMDSKTEKDIYKEFVNDITIGVSERCIRAGIIGEIGCSWPLLKNERK
jgi:phosphotriesterase-related protein